MTPVTDADYNHALIEFLKKSPPETWHQVAWSWNWDNGLAPLEWLIRQPECDQGTALLIYWYAGGPSWSKDSKDCDEYQRDVFELVKEIERNYVSGFYQNGNLAFDPRYDCNGRDWTKEHPEPAPEIFYQPSPGEKVGRKPFEDGYPPEVLAAVEVTNRQS